MSETDIAARVVAWLEHDGWEVYQEVEGRNGRCDIYGVRGRLAWAIEVKKSFGLRVIEQAHGWIGYANLVSIAVPNVSSSFGARLCEQLGIGTIETTMRQQSYWRRTDKGRLDSNGNPREDWERVELPPDLTVRERAKPRLWRRCKRPKLFESQKTFAPAGNNFGKYVTGASEVKRQLILIVNATPGIALNDAIGRIPHHYASDKSARSTLIKYIEWKQVPEVRIERIGRSVHLYPATT